MIHMLRPSFFLSAPYLNYIDAHKPGALPDIPRQGSFLYFASIPYVKVSMRYVPSS